MTTDNLRQALETAKRHTASLTARQAAGDAGTRSAPPLDHGTALRLVLDELEGPDGARGSVTAVSLVREDGGGRVHFTALADVGGRGATTIYRGHVGPDWSAAVPGRLRVQWRPPQVVYGARRDRARELVRSTPEDVTP